MIPKLKTHDRSQQTSEVTGNTGTKPSANAGELHEVSFAPFAQSARSENPRATARRKIGILSRVKSAALRGVLAATIIGAAIGIGSVALSDKPAQTKQVPQLQLVQKTPSTAAQDAARMANAKLDTLPEKTRIKQAEILQKLLNAPGPNYWRDTKPFNADGTVNMIIEIALGTRDKYEMDLESNKLVLDRVIHESVGGYPINYGMVPGTFSWDGDPFDAVVLGPRLESGAQVQGKIIGIYHMIDEKGFDPHLVLSPVDAKGNALYTLDDAKKQEIAEFVVRYKKPDAQKGKWAKMVGWGDAEDGLRFTRTVAGFFDAAR
jgi:inorganic pyrophosphatase